MIGSGPEEGTEKVNCNLTCVGLLEDTHYGDIHFFLQNCLKPLNKQCSVLLPN